MNIYVGNLDFKVNEKILEGIFNEYGTVNDVKIITDKYSGKSRGFGFVTMENKTEAGKAIEELNGSKLESRELVVNVARPREEKF
jgi:RNA recognition motif-containing protein